MKKSNKNQKMLKKLKKEKKSKTIKKSWEKFKEQVVNPSSYSCSQTSDQTVCLEFSRCCAHVTALRERLKTDPTWLANDPRYGWPHHPQKSEQKRENKKNKKVSVKSVKIIKYEEKDEQSYKSLKNQNNDISLSWSSTQLTCTLLRVSIFVSRSDSNASCAPRVVSPGGRKTQTLRQSRRSAPSPNVPAPPDAPATHAPRDRVPPRTGSLPLSLRSHLAQGGHRTWRTRTLSHCLSISGASDSFCKGRNRRSATMCGSGTCEFDCKCPARFLSGAVQAKCASRSWVGFRCTYQCTMRHEVWTVQNVNRSCHWCTDATVHKHMGRTKPMRLWNTISALTHKKCPQKVSKNDKSFSFLKKELKIRKVKKLKK